MQAAAVRNWPSPTDESSIHASSPPLHQFLGGLGLGTAQRNTEAPLSYLDLHDM